MATRTSLEFFREARVINNIFDSSGRSLSEKHNIMLAGGAIRSIFSRETPVDYDLFFVNEESRNSFETEWVKRFAEVHKPNKLMRKITLTKVFESDNANTYVYEDGYNKKTFQLIKKIYGTPEVILDKFDIRVCKAAYCFGSKSWVYDDYFFSDLACRQVIVSSKLSYPFATLFRMFKYQQKGYFIPPSEIVKVSMNCHAIKIDTLKDWKEQMLGVDTILLNKVITEMQKKDVDLNSKFDVEFVLDYINQFILEQDL